MRVCDIRALRAREGRSGPRWGVVSLPSANAQALAVWTGDLYLDLAPAPVGLLVGGDVANRILCLDLAKHLLVDSIEILDAAREESRSSSLFRNLLEQCSLH